MKRKERDMLKGPLFGNIILYTIPIILTSILQLLFNAADLVVVGRFCGSVSVAAVGATGSLTNLIVNLFIGLSVGTGVTVAQKLGAGDHQATHRAVHTALPAAIISGLFLTVIGIVFSESFLRMMETPENVLELSAVYMRIYFAGMTFSMIYNFCASILRAAGDTRSPLIFLSIAGVVNVVLNVIFVTVLHMNVAGVALATAISQAVSAVAMVLVLMHRRDACQLTLSSMRIYKKELLEMIRIGLPAGVQGSMFSISNVLIQSSVNSFGDVFMSGSAASGNIEGFVYVIQNAFYQAAVNFVGQNHGARLYRRVKKIVWICLGSVTVAGLISGLTAYAFGRQLLSIYITDSPLAIEYGIQRMLMLCVPYFVCGLMDVSTGALRGLGASIAPMLISVLGVCGIRIGWVMTIFQVPAFHTPECLFISYLFSWTVTFLCEFGMFLLIYRKRVKADPGLLEATGA